MTSKIVCLSIAAVLYCGHGLGARTAAMQTQSQSAGQAQTIKVKTELVEVRAVVTDRRGRIIDDLKKDDFELLENNRPLEISFFSVMRVRGSGSNQTTADTVKPDHEVAPKTARDRLAEAPARSVVIFVDTLHLSIFSLLQVKQALRRFVDEQLTDQDMVALVTSGGTLGIAEQFTRNRPLLRYAIERIDVGQAGRESMFTPYLAAQVQRERNGMVVREARAVAESILAQEECRLCTREILDWLVEMRADQILAEASYRRKVALLTLKEVAERMAGLPGQRLIALLSDGFTLLDENGTPSGDGTAAVPSQSKMVQGIWFYRRDQSCAYAFRVYRPAKASTDSQLVMQTEFLQAGKPVVQTPWQPVSVLQVAQDKKGIAVGGQIRLGKFKPGVYELRITVRDRKSKQTAQRTAVFGVEEIR
jgi:VWFA-related protein